MNELAQRAVQAALKGDWTEAKNLNKSILEVAIDDKDALCRLARVYQELGKISKALSTYKKVLSLDPYNSIAQKAVDRLGKADKNSTSSNHNGHTLTPSAGSFLEEPGKTKTATLIHLGATGVLTGLTIGQSVQLVTHPHRVGVETLSGEFIGRLPDDLAHRILTFSRAGNEYETCIKSATSQLVKVFIRELKRGSRVTDIPSFPVSEKPDYVAFTSPDLIHKERPAVNTFEEEASPE
ncbi:MAG: tetratricopeptide repeat protein [Candidatus Blackburnbacteria bacterium]|nr:tetratricopeptide repeat protein [Candidatus Blackburnbacteria bacterium]